MKIYNTFVFRIVINVLMKNYAMKSLVAQDTMPNSLNE